MLKERALGFNAWVPRARRAAAARSHFGARLEIPGRIWGQVFPSRIRK